MDLSVKYMGIDLQNPLVVSSSGLTNSIENIKKCEANGAGAVVLKSLFEEQVESDIQKLEGEGAAYPHPEAVDYMRQMKTWHSQGEYLKLIQGAKRACSIPVIASLNAVSPKWWVSCLKQIENAGADGLELNISLLPTDMRKNPAEYEHTYVEVLKSVKSETSLPLSVKIGNHFTSIPNMAFRLANAGAQALVLFNRFYRLDMNIEKMSLKRAIPFSTPVEMARSLRWISLLYGQLDIDMAASTGVHTGASAVKMLLAGAAAVQVCSTLYQNGIEHLQKIRKEMEAWMARHRFQKIDDFKGKLCQEQSENPEQYERLQYVKALLGKE